MSLPPELVAMLASGGMGAPPDIQQVRQKFPEWIPIPIPFVLNSEIFSPVQMAQMLQMLGINAVSQQDEQDRRWQNMTYEIEQLKEQGREPTTGTGYQKLLIKHGLQPDKPLPAHIASKPMGFDQFMEKCGRYGWSILPEYEAQGQPDAPRRCDGCGQRGAVMRCDNCGEFYCNATCQRKGWKDHRELCGMAGRGEPTSLPELLSSEEYEAKILRPTATFAQNVTAERSQAPMAARAPASGNGKNAKKNKKKREKAKAAKAEAANSAAAREDVD